MFQRKPQQDHPDPVLEGFLSRLLGMFLGFGFAGQRSGFLVGGNGPQQVVEQQVSGIKCLFGRNPGVLQEIQQPTKWRQCFRAHGLSQLDDFCRVRNRDQCGAQLLQQRPDSHRGHFRCRKRGLRDRTKKFRGNINQQFLLGLHVPVQRPDLHIELTGQPAHREVGQAEF